MSRILNNRYLLGLTRISSVTASRVRRMREHFGSLESAWNCTEKSAFLRAGLKPEWIDLFFTEREMIDIDHELKRLSEHNIHLLSIDDERYPFHLREIHNAPQWLYVWGEIPRCTLIAVVGTRKMTDYMKRVTEDMTRALVGANVCVVSGLAFGVDAQAHRTVVSQKGKTVAVLGSGLNVVTPQQHTKIAEEIVVSGGCVVSEYPLDMVAAPYHFPQRNRIISGLCTATVVIGAGEKSGALITARLAMEQNRDVYAVPGTIYAEGSKGCHRLIRDGAGLIDSPETLIAGLGFSAVQMKQPELPMLSERETIVLKQVTVEPIHFDDLARTCELDASSLGVTLTMLESYGLVESHPGMRYSRTNH